MPIWATGKEENAMNYYFVIYIYALLHAFLQKQESLLANHFNIAQISASKLESKLVNYFN